MTQKTPTSLSIAPDHNKATLSKGQKAFNTLIRQLEKRRQRLGAWEAIEPVFHTRYRNEVVPLEKRFRELRIEIVHRLAQAYDLKGLTSAQRDAISGLVADRVPDLIDGQDDGQLRAIFEKHAGFDFDRYEADELDDMKRALEAMLGTELGDDVDIHSHEDLLRHLEAKIEEQYARRDAEEQSGAAPRATRKKSAKQIAEQERLEAEKAQLSQSIREVYRKLASALHPDREPDPEERKRKTALMQRANKAYEKNNLLQLLELQLELEHIDQHAINNISDDLLKRYNTILKEQLFELDQEIFYVEARFRDTYGFYPDADIAPGNVVRMLLASKEEIEESIDEQEEELRRFGDLKALKRWLTNTKREMEAEKRRFRGMF